MRWISPNFSTAATMNVMARPTRMHRTKRRRSEREARGIVQSLIAGKRYNYPRHPPLREYTQKRRRIFAGAGFLHERLDRREHVVVARGFVGFVGAVAAVYAVFVAVLVLEEVVAFAAEEHVVAASAFDRVGPAVAKDLIVSAAAVDAVAFGIIRSVDRVITAAALDNGRGVIFIFDINRAVVAVDADAASVAGVRDQQIVVA